MLIRAKCKVARPKLLLIYIYIYIVITYRRRSASNHVTYRPPIPPPLITWLHPCPTAQTQHPSPLLAAITYNKHLISSSRVHRRIRCNIIIIINNPAPRLLHYARVADMAISASYVLLIIYIDGSNDHQHGFGALILHAS